MYFCVIFSAKVSMENYFRGGYRFLKKMVSHREIFMHGYFESILTVVLKLFGYLAKVFF